MGSKCLFSETTATDPSNAYARWDAASAENDNFVRFTVYVAQEGYGNNELGYVSALYSSNSVLAGAIQIGQTGNNLYYDDSVSYSNLKDINAHLATNWLLVEYYYHDGSGSESASWGMAIWYWDGSAWQSVGSTSGSLSSTATVTPKINTIGLGGNQGEAGDTQVYIDRLWWDDAAFPVDPGASTGAADINEWFASYQYHRRA
jgi:hypothetical protein